MRTVKMSMNEAVIERARAVQQGSVPASEEKTAPALLPDQIEMVQESFRHVEPIAEAAAGLFYGRLFEIAPNLREMFPESLDEQGRKLMAVLGLVVKGLSKPETILPAVSELGRRHVGYGVTADQYTPVGEALLWTLGEGLGDAFTPEVEEAWASAYGLLSSVMIESANQAAA